MENITPVVVVYHVTIVAIGYGLLKKFLPMAIGCVLSTAGSDSCPHFLAIWWTLATIALYSNTYLAMVWARRVFPLPVDPNIMMFDFSNLNTYKSSTDCTISISVGTYYSIVFSLVFLIRIHSDPQFFGLWI